MANIFLWSDTHFDHANILTFTREDGSLLRNFASIEEMNARMIDACNSVVKPQDKLYHLGDVAMSAAGIAHIARCNGHKRLIRGNHDSHDLERYTPFFEEIYGTRLIDRLLLSHIPIHPESLGKAVANVHGHVHNNVPQGHFGPRYYNVSVEAIDYTPVALEDLKLLIQKQQEDMNHVTR